MSLLVITNIHKSYTGSNVLKGVDLSVDTGEIVCLLGPSGCGKTTLLRIVAGLEVPDQGSIQFDGRDLTRLPVHRRQFGFMFQQFSLFPHRSVGENVAFGLRMQRASQAAISDRVEEVLDLVNLEGYEGRSVFALSGGEQQRVALARSLAPTPRLLLLDEPLGSLDRTLREELMIELRHILKRVGVTALYVTHDQQEAFAIAERIVVMNDGRFEQVGTPQEVYGRPANEFVARFLGLANLLPGTITTEAPQQIQTPLGVFSLAGPEPAGAYTLLIRPEIERQNLEQKADGGQIVGLLTSVSFRGSDYHIDVAAEGQDGVLSTFHFVLPTRHRGGPHSPTAGEEIWVGIDASQLVLLER